MRIPRFRNLAIPIVGALTTLMATGGAAAAKGRDYSKYQPAGMGALLPSPGTRPAGQSGTLFERYSNSGLYQLDSQLGWDEIGYQIQNGIAVIFMGLTVLVGLAAVVVVQWAIKFTSVKELQDSITHAISGAAGTVSETLLPTALAVGALVAWANHRKAGGSALSQLGWVAASGILSVSLLSTPQVWVDGIDSTRSIGSSVAMEAASAGLGAGTNEPIDIKGDVSFNGSTQDNMLRKSADAIWRSYVVTPWCVAEFGNLDTCKEFAQRLWDEKGDNTKARESWLHDNVCAVDGEDGCEGGVGRPAVDWRQGKNAGRVPVTIAAFVCVVLFAALAIALAFASLASLIGALMLLLAGVVFACMWVIPGRPRQWGMRWFDMLLGFTLQSFVSTMVLGCVLILNTASVSMIGKYGWFASAGISITSAVVAFKFRGVMESIVGVTGAMSPGASAAGMAIARGAGRMAGRAGGWTAKKSLRGAGWAGKQAGRGAGKLAMAGARKGAEVFDEKVSHVGKAASMYSWMAKNPAPLGAGGGRAGNGPAQGSSGRQDPGGGGGAGGGRRGPGGASRGGTYGAGAGRTVDLPERRSTPVGTVRPRSVAGKAAAAQRDNARNQPGNPQTGRTGAGAGAAGQQAAATRRHPSPSRPGGGGGQDSYRFRTAPKPRSVPRQQRISDARRTAVTNRAVANRSASGAAATVRTPAPAPGRRRRRRNGS
ncbi:hypothetical protein [Streptomyces sp. UNOB3_S3]|uniref:hypothetical protein n=1 Tax=Streptomyces sp. UNOB3_S3 TaxID=2871682 RepID=UPI001E2F44AB|nr:hypothetical protein [Streptomyces sp. UNOB3_S3]MCC3777016.1 hypothetical protein [Streptomyces sp. UNOB3_S3]